MVIRSGLGVLGVSALRFLVRPGITLAHLPAQYLGSGAASGVSGPRPRPPRLQSLPARPVVSWRGPASTAHTHANPLIDLFPPVPLPPAPLPPFHRPPPAMPPAPTTPPPSGCRWTRRGSCSGGRCPSGRRACRSDRSPRPRRSRRCCFPRRRRDRPAQQRASRPRRVDPPVVRQHLADRGRARDDVALLERKGSRRHRDRELRIDLLVDRAARHRVVKAEPGIGPCGLALHARAVDHVHRRVRVVKQIVVGVAEPGRQRQRQRAVHAPCTNACRA